jgi:hypothetical protein
MSRTCGIIYVDSWYAFIPEYLDQLDLWYFNYKKFSKNKHSTNISHLYWYELPPQYQMGASGEEDFPRWCCMGNDQGILN